MPFGYTPEDERDDEDPPEFLRLQKELADMDVEPPEPDTPAPAPAPETPRSPAAPTAGPKSSLVPSIAPARKPMDDGGLQLLQDKARDTSQRANLGRVGDAIAAAFGGYKTDDSYWDNVEKQGKQPVADLLQARGLQRQNTLDAQNADLAAARMKALLARAQAKPAAVDRMGAKKALDDVTAAGEREIVQKMFPEALVKRGITPEMLGQYPLTAIRDLKASLEKAEGIEHTDSRAEKNLGEAKVGHAQRAHKQQYIEEQNTAAGYEGKALSTHDAGDLADTAATADQIHSKIREIKELIHQNGGLSLNKASPLMAVIKQKFTELQPLSVKAAGMGSFTEGHRELFAHAVQDPDALLNLVNNKRFTAQLDDLDQAADLALASKERSLGQQKKKAPTRTPMPEGELGAPTSPPPDTRPRRTDPATGETRIWDGTKWVKP